MGGEARGSHDPPAAPIATHPVEGVVRVVAGLSDVEEGAGGGGGAGGGAGSMDMR